MDVTSLGGPSVSSARGGGGKCGDADKNNSDKAGVSNKEYERELSGSSETLRHLQRLQVTSGSPCTNIPSLVNLPLQLGFCSADDFHVSDDDCKKGSKKRQLPDFRGVVAAQAC